MAEVERRRTLINPARRHKKRRNKARRKMSPKQIAIFGSKRQKAALKASRKRKRSKPKRKNSARARHLKAHRRKRPNRASTPARPKRRANRSTRRRRARRRNPGGIVEVALNPAPKRRKSVARTRKRRKSSSRRRHNRRRNPAPVTRRHRRRRSYSHRQHNRRHHRRNPSRAAGVTSLLTNGAAGVGGFFATRAATELVLGASNTGVMGYIGNIVAAIVGGKLLGMFLKNKSLENSFMIGGGIATVARIISDQTPYGAALKRYGLAGRGFGDYEASTWLSPARYLNAAQSAAVDIPLALRPAPAAGMAGLGGGSYSRARGTY